MPGLRKDIHIRQLYLECHMTVTIKNDTFKYLIYMANIHLIIALNKLSCIYEEIEYIHMFTGLLTFMRVFLLPIFFRVL